MKKIKLSIRSVFLLALMVVGSWARAQKAYPVEIGGLLAKVPIPSGSADCFRSCTTTTDPSNGSVSIKDNGAAFNELNEELERILKAAISDARYGNVSRPSAPSATQPADIALMKLIGQAQSAIMQITLLSGELSRKVAALDKSGIDKVKIGPNCPDVQQGGYAGPTCSCMIGRGKDYAQRRVLAEDDYLRQVAALLREYIAKLRVQVAIVDDMETKAKLGDAVANPVFKQQVILVQREALSAVPAALGISSDTWKDAATRYAAEVNAASGASEGCYNHK